MLKGHFDHVVLGHCALSGQVNTIGFELIGLDLVSKFLVDLSFEAKLRWSEVESQYFCLGVLTENVFNRI